ncbi:MAG: hypothetical protein Q8L24_02305, partial [bacterium]|nr:hypothetical protein [bacterium]
WGRGFRKLITPNAARKAVLELNVLNEKAAELKKLQEITDGSEAALASAVRSYIASADQLRLYLVAIKGNSDQALEGLVNNLIDRSLRHFWLLNDLASQAGVDGGLISDLDTAAHSLVLALAQVPGNLVAAEDFRVQFLDVVSGLPDAFKELRAADLADRLSREVSGDNRPAIEQLREDLLLKFSGRLEGSVLAGGSLGDLNSVSGDRLERLRLIDEVREVVTNPQLRSELNIVRQKILDQVSANDGIKQEQAQAAIIDAQNLLTAVEDKISARASVKSSIKELVDRAKFNLSQADQFMAQENFGGAFGHATAAQASLNSAMDQLSVSDFDASAALESAKKSFDYWTSKIREAGLTKADSPKLFALMDDAERRIVALDKLIQSKAAPESISASLRSIKILLATIEEFLKQLSEPKPAKVPAALQSAPVNEAGDSASRREAKTTSVLRAESTTVVITEKGFDPAAIKVFKGSKVVWLNKDIRPHWPAVISSQTLPGFDAMEGLSQGESFAFVFDQVGVWKYNDRLNPGLTGVVEVSE